METNVHNSTGQVYDIARNVAASAADKQRSLLFDHLTYIAEKTGRRALASVLLSMADEKFQFNWGDIYASCTSEDVNVAVTDREIKCTQALREGTFPMDVLHETLLADTAIRDRFLNYVMQVACVPATSLIYGTDVTQPPKFISYSQQYGIACSPTRSYKGREVNMAVGHVALEGHKTPAALLAFTMCVKRWARTLRGALNKAIKKERFSANTLPHVERLVRALSSVKEITPRSGEGYELNLLHDKLAQEILGAVDSLDSQVIAEIREALIRYLLTSDVGQEGLRFKKLKRHIKEHGAILSEDLLKCMIKDVDSDFEPASLWENVAMLDFVGVARSYVRSMYLCSDSLDLAQDWACL